MEGAIIAFQVKTLRLNPLFVNITSFCSFLCIMPLEPKYLLSLSDYTGYNKMLRWMDGIVLYKVKRYTGSLENSQENLDFSLFQY